jgi:hypothetical protein
MGIFKKKINPSPEFRLGCLSVIAAFAVSYVRHGVEHHWASWASAEQFFISWFIHWVALNVLLVAAAAATIWLHKLFLGYEYEGRNLEFGYHVLVVVLVAAISIAFLAHYIPTGDFED